MKRGFTLVEMLAIIIVLGIISNIAIGGIIKITDKSKQKAFEASVNGYLKAIETDNFDRGGLMNYYTLTNGKITNDTSSDNIKVNTGTKENGKLEISIKGTINGSIYNDKKCAKIINNKITYSNDINDCK